MDVTNSTNFTYSSYPGTPSLVTNSVLAKGIGFRIQILPYARLCDSTSNINAHKIILRARAFRLQHAQACITNN